ncbi:hypothetical protein MJ563_26990 [Klebsiella pneumoniae]|nr:hypothetical protein MJ563_26990 [Klebsiella pneumoniae]
MIGTGAAGSGHLRHLYPHHQKHNYLVRDIAELPQVISDAFRITQSGRPGRCG